MVNRIVRHETIVVEKYSPRRRRRNRSHFYAELTKRKNTGILSQKYSSTNTQESTMSCCKACKSTVGVYAVVELCGDCIKFLVPPEEKTEAKKSTRSEPGWALNTNNSTANKNVIHSLTVHPSFAKVLKDHQKEGARFIYRNSFPDCSYFDGNAHESEINGCILAHFMGLGKSLTLISVLHTVMTCPILKNKGLLHTALLVVPANTLTNWMDEVYEWTGNLKDPLKDPLKVHNLGSTMKGYQEKMLKTWKQEGGLLLLSETHFLSVGDKIVKNYPPDILVLDEAHTMVKNASTKTFKKLQKIVTKRRICLTGTPIQNNLTEYYQMLEFIKPGVVGVKSVAEFEKLYREPVERGLPSDATLHEKREALKKQVELTRKLKPYVQRRGKDVLRNNLKPLYDYLLYIEPSKIQQKLVKSHKRQQNYGYLTTNFFRAYADLAPMLNHPGCLKVVKGGRGAKIAWKKERDEWLRFLKGTTYGNLEKARNSPKFIVLAHILAMADDREKKVLVFSKCLKTLDLVEEFLCFRDWKSRVGSLEHFKGKRLGGWKKNKDYLRIDGGISSGKRGELVAKFNDPENSFKAFLISSEAGGVGINLCSARIVVILDNHFNPSVSNQCVSRAHRMGQEEEVSVFRLAIRDSVESKVYKRSVNKTGVATSVLDGIHFDSNFSTHELDDLQSNDIIMTCDKCGKRRLLPETQDAPEDYFDCSMNLDPSFMHCSIDEDPKLKQQSLERDVDKNNDILQHILQVVNTSTMRSKIVAGYCPVEDNHGHEICCDEAIAKLDKEIAAPEDQVFVGEVQLPPWSSKRKYEEV